MLRYSDQMAIANIRSLLRDVASIRSRLEEHGKYGEGDEPDTALGISLDNAREYVKWVTEELSDAVETIRKQPQLPEGRG